MPATHELDATARIVRSRAWGVFDEQDSEDHLRGIQKLFDDGVLDGTWAQIFDLSAVERFDLSAEAIKKLADANPWPSESRRGLIVGSDMGYGLARMYEMRCGERGERVGVFRTEFEALEWIRAERAVARRRG